MQRFPGTFGSAPIQLVRSSPALRFIQVEGDQPQQAAKPLVMAMQGRIEGAIADYNSRPGRPAGLGDLELFQVRERFLRFAGSKGKEGWRSLATALISYFLEWDYRSTLIVLRPGDGTAEPFFIHLFKGCVLFGSLLKANPKDTPPSGASTLGAVYVLCPRLGSLLTSVSVTRTSQGCLAIFRC